MKKIIFVTLGFLLLISCVSTPTQRSTASAIEKVKSVEEEKYPRTEH
jgi:hypothetical protein